MTACDPSVGPISPGSATSSVDPVDRPAYPGVDGRWDPRGRRDGRSENSRTKEQVLAVTTNRDGFREQEVRRYVTRSFREQEVRRYMTRSSSTSMFLPSAGPCRPHHPSRPRNSPLARPSPSRHHVPHLAFPALPLGGPRPGPIQPHNPHPSRHLDPIPSFRQSFPRST